MFELGLAFANLEEVHQNTTFKEILDRFQTRAAVHVRDLFDGWCNEAK